MLCLIYFSVIWRVYFVVHKKIIIKKQQTKQISMSPSIFLIFFSPFFVTSPIFTNAIAQLHVSWAKQWNACERSTSFQVVVDWITTALSCCTLPFNSCPWLKDGSCLSCDFAHYFKQRELSEEEICIKQHSEVRKLDFIVRCSLSFSFCFSIGFVTSRGRISGR